MDSLSSYLPAHEGILPKWLLFISLVSVANSLQAYISLKPTQQVYNGRFSPSKPRSSIPGTSIPSSVSPVTPLSARTFGTWTLLSSVIRLYAAYHISNPQVYQLAFASYVIAWLHFGSEWLVFGTARLGKGLIGPIVVATSSLVWMWSQWEFYTGR